MMPAPCRRGARKATPEKLVQSAVTRYLRARGYLVERNNQGLGSVPGRPDLQAAKRGVIIMVECKGPKGRLSEAQEQYKARLEAQGIEVFVPHSIEEFMEKLEAWEEQTWPGENFKRLV